MDAENLIVHVVFFSLEVCATSLSYLLYRNIAERLESIKEAPYLEVDSNLKKCIEDNNGVIKYVALSGKIKALTAPLRSQFVPHLRGVFHERVTVERKVKWNPFFGIWFSSSNLLNTVNNVPFALCSKPLNAFEKRISVEIAEPLAETLTFQEFLIPTVYNEFQCHHEFFGYIVFNNFCGEKTLGIQEIEKLLCEDDTLLAVGKLVIENNKMKIIPPDEGLIYFLTPLSLDSIIGLLNKWTEFFKVTTIIIGAFTLVSFIYLSRLAFLEIKRRINRRDKKKSMKKKE